jgi:CBS domain-containing protein
MISLDNKWILRSLKLTIGGYFMNTVRQLLQDKVQEVSSVEPDKSAHDAMEMMADKKIGALLVLEAGKLIGIISERDYPGKAKALDKPLQEVLVKEIMSPQVVHVSPDDTIEHCMELVTKNHIRHLPVLENDQIIGIISIGDLSHI